MLTSEIQVGQTISFSVYPASYIGLDFTRVKVDAVLNAQIAGLLGFDVMGMHAAVYPTLPQNTNNDPLSYTYYQLSLQSGGKVIVADKWIMEDTLVVDSVSPMTLYWDNVSAIEKQRIINAVTANGVPPTSIS